MKKSEINLSEVREDYLETILRLAKNGAPVRLVDIAKEHGVSKATVSDALAWLGAEGYIEYEKYRPVTLTPRGREVAKRTFEKHKLLLRFLGETLGIPPKEAEIAACRMEHAIGSKIAVKLAELMEAISGEFGSNSKAGSAPAAKKEKAARGLSERAADSSVKKGRRRA